MTKKQGNIYLDKLEYGEKQLIKKQQIEKKDLRKCQLNGCGVKHHFGI